MTQREIADMDYIFYKNVIQELCLKLNYEDNRILMARDYCDNDMIKNITNNNPLRINLDKEGSNQQSGKRVTLGMLKNMGVIK